MDEENRVVETEVSNGIEFVEEIIIEKVEDKENAN